MAVERSRSGKGIHFWIYFVENIPVNIARKFGSSLITYAMNKHHELPFKTYDRLIPTQDNLPKGGFGNLYPFHANICTNHLSSDILYLGDENVQNKPKRRSINTPRDEKNNEY